MQALVLFVVGLVLYALFRQAPIPVYFHHMDTIGHFLVFLLLLLLPFRLLRPVVGVRFLALLLLILAIGSELIQGSIVLPLRTYSFSDVAANIAGLATACLVVAWNVRFAASGGDK